MGIMIEDRSNDRRLLQRLYRFNSKLSLAQRVKGLEFTRCFEYSSVLELLQKRRMGRVLDIGSLRSPFPLFLASEGYEVVATDIDADLSYQREWARHTAQDTVADFYVAMQDATALGFEAGSFDAVTCISTVEHLPGEGDRLAMQEFARVLRPNGWAFVSVPYTRDYREGRWGRCFQRYYDEEQLEHRLVNVQGLALLERGFLLGDSSRHYYSFFYRLPERVRLALGWAQIHIALHLLERDVASAENAGVAWLLMEKSP
jgi:SAM-dependent methyltransferase